MGLGDKKKKFLEKREQEETAPKVLAGRYEIEAKIIGRGVSSTVIPGVDLLTGRKVAIKKIMRFCENKHESLRILRQIILLRVLDHPNIIKLREVILEGENKNELYLVLDFLPYDIKKVFKSNKVLNLRDIKNIVFQLLAGLKFCHECQVLHRDLKPENILVTDDFSEVKLCDFGLARAVLTEDQKEYENKQEEKEKQEKRAGLSAHVTTRWYRAPELIILQRKYNSAIDMWSVGCILAELTGMLEENCKNFLERKVLFPGKACYPLSPPKNNETNYKKINDFPHSFADQLSVIFDILGTPDDISFITDERARNYIKSFGKIEKKPFNKIFDYIPGDVQDFLEKSLRFNPNTRLTITQAIAHPLFDQVRKDFELNVNMVGEPVITDIEGLNMEQIKERVIMEHEYYLALRKKEQTERQHAV